MDLTDQDRADLDAWVAEFDRTWNDTTFEARAGQLPPDAAWRLAGLAEMTRIDIDRQWTGGREVRVESYLDRFPELRPVDDAVVGLILAEIEVCRRVGAPADLESYLGRFPEHAGEIARRIAASGRLG